MGTMVVPLAASTVWPSGMTTMAWVPPVPGMLIGVPARWVARSIGMTTLCTEPDPGDGDGADEVVADPVVAGGTVVDEADGVETTPSLVTT
jgi:hypothetical protein